MAYIHPPPQPFYTKGERKNMSWRIEIGDFEEFEKWRLQENKDRSTNLPEGYGVIEIQSTIEEFIKWWKANDDTE